MSKRRASYRVCDRSGAWRSVAAAAGAVALLAGLACESAFAAGVVLRIRAGNPAKKVQPVDIRSNLPARIRREDVLDTGGLELAYDVKSDIYYVHKRVELPPDGKAIFDVELKDVWVIDEVELEAVVAHSEQLVRKLRGTGAAEQSVALEAGIKQAVAAIKERQQAAAIERGVAPIQHIRAYESNVVAWERAKRDVGRLENMVLGTGQDPGSLVGEVGRLVRDKSELRLPESEFATARVKISVRNTSPTEARTVSIKRELPPEISEADVTDAGGLELRTDHRRGVVYVVKEDVQLEPGGSAEFTVTIRDKWNINTFRIPSLREKAEDLLNRVRARGKYSSVEESLEEILARLEAVEQETGPEEMSDQYVAFYRAQGFRLDDVEQDINRIQTALRPIEKTSKMGFPVKPPSRKTTWLVIWIILGFLGVVSLLFFLRWFGRGRAEQVVNATDAGE